MRTRTTLANAELAVMELLWAEGRLSARDVRERLYPGAEKAQHGTVQRLLQRLEDKGYVVRDGAAMSDDDRAASIADRVVAILRDAQWRHQITRTAPEFVRTHYGMERMIAETLALYGVGAARP